MEAPAQVLRARAAQAFRFAFGPWGLALACGLLVSSESAAGPAAGNAPGSGAVYPALRAPSARHPNSFSVSELHIRGRLIELHLRAQVLSLGEVIEGFDDDLDGHAEDGELEASRDAIAAYIAEHYRIVVGADTAAEAALAKWALAGKCVQVVEGPMALDPMNEVSEWVDVRFEFDAGDKRFTTLGAFVDLFEVTSPGHSDSCAVVWNGLELGAWMFAQDAETHVFQASEEMMARNAPAFQRLAIRGAKGLEASWDVALLALLLVVTALRSRSSGLMCGGVLVAAVVVGILVTPELPERAQYLKFARVTSALALVYLALDHLIHRSGRTRLLEPLVFGAILGFREATLVLPELALEAEPAGAPLRGFAFGLGAVLLALVLIAAMALQGRTTPAPSGESLNEGSADQTVAGPSAGAELTLGPPFAPAAVANLVAALALGLGSWSAFGILFP